MEHDFTEQMDLAELTAICREKTLTSKDWYYISVFQHLTEDFIREFKDELDWEFISEYQHLTENFMREFADEVDWWRISVFQYLSEDFMREFADQLNWELISENQHLTEYFMREFADNLNWDRISKFQHLSENFMRKFTDKLNWWCISEHQCLTEDFMRECADELNWQAISEYQHLSEDFMRECADKFDRIGWRNISKYQELSEDFISEFADKIDIAYVNNSWRKKSVTEKKAVVEATGLYECHEDYFIAYKGIRANRYSYLNFQYQYEPGHTYETFADYSEDENSFGFSAWTYEGATGYCNKLIVTCKVYYKDVARVVHDGGKIRCSKITILD